MSNKFMELFKVYRLDTEGYFSRLLVLVKANIMAQQGGSNEDGIEHKSLNSLCCRLVAHCCFQPV